MRVADIWHESRFRIVGWLCATLGWLLIRSLRLRIEIGGFDPLPVNQTCIVAFWHETLLLPLFALAPRRPHTLISRSDDGEYIARVAGVLGWRIVRGSSSRGAAMAMRGLLAAARRSDGFQAGITVDGPRGPRRHCKEGAVYLASRLGIPLVPLGVYVDRAWRAKSWDRFVLPKPFTRAAVVAEESLVIPPGLSSDQIALYCRQVEEALELAEQKARSLALGGSLEREAELTPHVHALSPKKSQVAA